MSTADKKNYGAESIQVIEGLDHVRKRPDMYIGSTGEVGLHHLVWEIIDNSIDEATNGYATAISVTLRDNTIEIADNGRGIPVEIHPEKKISAARLVFEVLGAGGKFNGESYKTHGGLHGVGASVVNALSSSLKVVIHRDKKAYSFSYKNSKLVEDVHTKGKSTKHGTIVTFTPDLSFFEDDVKFSRHIISSRLRELAFLNPGTKITFSDDKSDAPEVFLYQKGLQDFLAYINEDKDTVGKSIFIEGEKDGCYVSAALQYTADYTEDIYSFANNIATTDGGKHDEGFRAALTRALNETIKLHNAEKKRNRKDVVLQGSDAAEGLSAIISVRVPEPKFSGQTKAKLANAEVKGIVMSVIYDGLMEYFSKNPKASKDIIDKTIASYNYRESARTTRELNKQKNKLNGGSLFPVGKLADCSSSNSKEREVFIVEGDSAGGSAKAGRDQRFQAILPLRGKPLNVEKKSVKDLLSNEELTSIIQAFGTGFGKDFNIEALKYNKIIIATDADVDGHHIQVILLTFFYRYMRPLIEEGYVYLAKPPLYKIFNEKRIEYAYSDRELEQVKKKLGAGFQVQRYKGLGEMDASQLWDTTMNPDSRTLCRVTIDDAVMANKLITILMGNKTEPRRKYIMDHINMEVL